MIIYVQLKIMDRKSDTPKRVFYLEKGFDVPVFISKLLWHDQILDVIFRLQDSQYITSYAIDAPTNCSFRTSTEIDIKLKQYLDQNWKEKKWQ
jgi:hypothetical protein